MSEQDKIMNHTTMPIQYQQIKRGREETISADVIVETPVSLTVNGEHWLEFMCTPIELEALAVGFLFNEGLVHTLKEIASVRVCDSGDNVDVWTHHSVNKPTRWRRTSGCSGGMTAVDTNSSTVLSLNGATLSIEMVGNLITQLFTSQQLYRSAGGVHTSAMSDGKRIFVTAEDIGRHNTLDKIAGLCLLEAIDFPRRVLLTTGRISSEMMQKSYRLGASIVISCTAPSSLSINLANSWGITLIGYARRNRFNTYTHPDRITPNLKVVGRNTEMVFPD